MWAHTIAVFIVNIQRYAAGTFHYSFALYGLLLFGLVFILLSGLLIHFSRTYIQGNRQQKRKIFLGNLTLAVCFFPVIFITPIGSLPIFAAIVSSLVLGFWNPYKAKATNTQSTEAIKKSEAAVPAGV
jgi:ABC-type Fe3+ transport system permease subunit